MRAEDILDGVIAQLEEDPLVIADGHELLLDFRTDPQKMHDMSNAEILEGAFGSDLAELICWVLGARYSASRRNEFKASTPQEPRVNFFVTTCTKQCELLEVVTKFYVLCCLVSDCSSVVPYNWH